MSRAGILAIGAVIVIGGFTQSAPRLCPLPLRVLPTAAPPRPVNADRERLRERLADAPAVPSTPASVALPAEPRAPRP